MKKAVIVGATSGIGKELAILYAKNGYTIGITGRRELLLDELKATNPAQFITSCFDCATANNAEKLDELVVQLGGMDLLVISSGTGEFNKFLDYEIENRTNQLNVVAFTQIADWGFNYFAKQKSGHLAAITSISGIRGAKAAPAYNASKAYQISYLQGLNQRSISNKIGITVTDIRPGFVDTAMAQGPSRFWVSSPQKAAKQIFAALQKKQKVVYITKRWRLIALLLKIVSRNVYNRM